MDEYQEDDSSPEDEFALPIGTGMDKMPRGAGVKFSGERAEQIRRLLDKFDEMRTRAYVESRSVHLGGPSER